MGTEALVSATDGTVPEAIKPEIKIEQLPL